MPADSVPASKPAKFLNNRKGYPARDALLLCLVLLMLLPAWSGCQPVKGMKKYSYSFTGCFDTVIQIIGYTATEAEFEKLAKLAESRFTELNALFDIYHAYPALNNIYTINQQAGIAPVQVDSRIIDLLAFYKEKDQLTPGTVNIALGPVLAVWQHYRTAALDGGAAELPSSGELARAALLCDPDKIVIDAAGRTVYLQEAGMMLDVGAVAKGYATELVAADLIAAGLTSGIISAGGSNIRLIGAPADGRSTWQIGLQDPDGNPLLPDDPPLDILLVNNQSVVTSGDYQRYYKVDGQIYHHLIDATTLQPARYFRAVTILAADSGLADFLSTAVFLLPYDEGRRLVDKIPDCEALWIFADGRLEATDGMRAVMKSTQDGKITADS